MSTSEYPVVKTFTQITENIGDSVELVACGEYYTMAVKKDGSLWTCGYNGTGQIGTNDTDSKYRFTRVTTNVNNDVKDVKCGKAHTLILKNDGTVWACGSNYNGQLGIGNQTDQTSFVKIQTSLPSGDSIGNIKRVACGHYHMVILVDSTVHTVGYNSYGQLGLGDGSDSVYTYFQATELPIEVDTSIGLPIEWLGNDANWFVSPVEGAEYGFALNNNGYYESQNKGKNETAAVCRLYIHNPKKENVTLHCTNYAESSYDYGIVSKRNVELSLTYEEDPASNCTVSFKNSNNSLEQQITLDAESGWYYIKFIKDNSNNNNNDSLIFTVSFGSPYAGQ